MFVPENPLPIVNKLSATWINTNKAVAELVQCNLIVAWENGQERKVLETPMADRAFKLCFILQKYKQILRQYLLKGVSYCY